MNRATPRPRASAHATAVAIGECGLLIRGPSGAGKTALARALIEAAALRGHFARLVADDRVWIVAKGGRILASPHPAIAGRLEIRGQGILATPHEAAVVIHGVIDLDASGPGTRAPARLPEPEALQALIEGISLPRLAIADARPAADAAADVLWFLASRAAGRPPGPIK